MRERALIRPIGASPIVSPPFRAAAALVALVVALGPGVAAADPAGAFARLEARWHALHDYTATIESHEVVGDQVSDHTLKYWFRKPDSVRLDILTGTHAGVTITWSGGSQATAYFRRVPFFKKRGDVRSALLTSVRGNSALTPHVGMLIDCFADHRSALVERAGPEVAGVPTDEIELPYAGITCPNDAPIDREVTRDVVDVSQVTGLPVLRERYAGDRLVERWKIDDLVVDGGIGDADLR